MAKNSKLGVQMVELPIAPPSFSGKMLGHFFTIERQKKMARFYEVQEVHFTWLTEVLIEAKKSFASPEIQLLPKTPSAKRCRAMRSPQTDTTQDEEESLPPKKTRRTKTTRKVKKEKSVESVKDDTGASEFSTDDTADESASARPRRGRQAKNNSAQPSKTTRASRSSRRNTKKQQEEDDKSTRAPILSIQPDMSTSLAETEPIEEEVEEMSGVEEMICSPGPKSIRTEPTRQRLQSVQGTYNMPIVLDSDAEPSPARPVVDSKTLPIAASEASIDAPNQQKQPVAKTANNSMSCRSAERPSSGNRLNVSVTGSPRSIPGFRMLHHVKQKARAYENYIHKSHNDLSTEGESICNTPSPVKTPGSTKMFDDPMKVVTPSKNVGSTTPNTPQTVVLKSRATLTLSQGHQPLLSPNSRCSINVNNTPTGPTSETGTRRSSACRRSVTGSLNGLRKSLSKRRSSILRQKLYKSSTTMKVKESQKDNSSPARSRSKLRLRKPTAVAGHQAGSSSEEITSSGESSEMSRKTRSKMRAPKDVPFNSEEDVESQASGTEKGEAPHRTTRSKMRVNKPPPTLTVSGTDSEADTPKVRTPRLCHASSSAEENTPQRQRSNKCKSVHEDGDDGIPSMVDARFKAPDTAAPCRSTRSKLRKPQQMDSHSPSVGYTGIRGGQPVTRGTPRAAAKRTALDSQCSGGTPAKKSFTEEDSSDFKDTTEHESGSDDDLIDRTPSPPCPKNKIVRPTHPSSFLNNLNKPKTPGTLPTNAAGNIISFIARNTPKKISQKERLSQKRKEQASRDKEVDNRLAKRQELIAKRAEEKKKRNEERLAAAVRRREELERQREHQKDVNSHVDKNKNMASQLLEDKQKEKQKLRDKRKAEADLRRKQEEEARLQKLKELEEEKRRHEEFMARKRAEEEAERQKRLAEAKRAEEERKAALERQQRAEQEKLRKAEELRQRQEQEKQRLREEREKRERAERERAELERQKERERQRQEELERARELERQRIAEERNRQEAERKAAEEERRIQATITKHNHALQPNNSLNTSTSSLPAKLNTTITKPHNPDSYEMTPQRKYIICNYDISDMKSDDSTDDEEAPRKPIPTWATGNSLKALLIGQTYHPPNLDDIFDIIEPLDLATVFKKKKARFHKRTSSAIWDSPILKPSGKH